MGGQLEGGEVERWGVILGSEVERWGGGNFRE